MRLPNYRKIISYAILGIFFVWLAIYIINNTGDFEKVLSLKWHYILIMVGTYTIFLYINGYIFKLIIGKLGSDLSIREGFFLAIMTTFFNLLTPFKGGHLARAVYLKRRYSFDYTKFMVSLVGNYLILFFMISLLILLATIFLYLEYQIFNLALTIVFAVIFISIILFALFTPTEKESQNWFIKKLNEIIKGWNLLKSDRLLLVKLSLLALVYSLVGILFMYFSFQSIGISLVFIMVLYLYLVTRVSFVFSITPSSLGIHEVLMIITASVVSISASDTILVAMINRTVGFLTVVILMSVFSWLVFKKNIFIGNSKSPVKPA